MNFLNVVLALPLLILWAFALVDLTRRNDLSTKRTLLWGAVVLLLPYVGVFAYLFLRPRSAPDATSADHSADAIVDELEAVVRGRADGDIEPSDARRQIHEVLHAETIG